MKRLTFAVILSLVSCLRAGADWASNINAAKAFSISPNSGQIASGEVLTFDSPVPMIPASLIDAGGQPWPFAVTPRLTGTFLWKSQTEGQFTVDSVVAGATHHFTLAPGLKDVNGHPIKEKGWSADFTTPAFSLSTDTESEDHLSAQPHIPLTSTYDVSLADVAELRERFAYWPRG